jgi:acetolactate synthase-1/2/3 large subunit
VIGDIGNAIWQMKEAIEVQSHWDFATMLKARAAEVAHTAASVGDQRHPIYPQHLVAQIRQAMPANGIICLDNGVYKIWFARNYPARQANTVLLDNALATMGAGLPSAMASAMVYPDRKVMAICGDGGFMMNSQELETAVRLKLNITVLILNDNSYGMIRWKQANMGFKDWGLTYNNPDFVKYAESYGAKGFRCENAASLPDLLAKCLGTPGVNLIEVPVDYSDNDLILNKQIKELSAKV